MTKTRSKSAVAAAQVAVNSVAHSVGTVEYQFPRIEPVDKLHEAAHEFMLRFRAFSAEHRGEISANHASMLDEVQYWLGRQQELSSEDHDPEDDSEEEFQFMDFGDHEAEGITNIVMTALGGRTAGDMWLYHYAEKDRLGFEAQMELQIEEAILNGKTENIFPHAIEKGIERLKRKGLLS